ncbi:TlpA family protein disulfide reductase [Kribbella sp. DT2]|uniref:TlpA family protein disulfide reductase n=1 Tax=Kribbella sp. DT2 TaxID=3393427 RepID=UPI003CF444FF
MIIATAVLTAAVVVIEVRHEGIFGSTTPTRQGQTADASSTGLTLYPVGERVPVPVVRGETLTGDQLAVSDLLGRIVVLNVWGSWCNPCRAETPELVRVANETRAQGVRFVGIDTRDNPAAARAFVQAFKMPNPSIIDEGGRVLLGFNGIVPFSAVPSTVVIDRSGRIAARVIGRISYATLTGVIEDLQSEGGTSSGGPGSEGR